jgi:choline dehydrogenase-like flavoprotein
MRDVIIVGAGGGGAVVAKELAERGLDVLLLESGPGFFDVERDWTHFEIDANNAATGYFRAGPVDRTKPPAVRDLLQNSAILQVSGVGGTTNHYLGNSPRAMPGVFLNYRGRDRDAYDIGHLFPFSYRDLLPYYEWVEATLPVQTAAMSTKDTAFLEGAERLGLSFQKGKDIRRASFRPQENAILQPKGTAGRTSDPRHLVFPLARGCTFCGHCLQGCFEPLSAPINLKAKRATSVSYVPMALTADCWSRGGKAITLLTDACAVRVTADEQGVARSVTWRIGATGELLTEEARVIVLAGGAIETPRLWLNSGLPNPNDWVGRGLTDHFFDVVIGIMSRDIRATSGPHSGARADFPGRGSIFNAGVNPAFMAQVLSLSDAGVSGAYDNGLAADPHEADGVGRLVGADLKTVLADIDRVLAITVNTDDDVEMQNRVLLSTALPPDEHGPVPRVEMRLRNRSARTLANREFLVARSVELLKAAGAVRVHRLQWPAVLIHMHATMRMGLDPAESVLNESGEARWIRRLFIADNSALSNALGGPNPTLTTQALATRTAEKIFCSYFEGDPWVEREAPVSSIDHEVTKAVVGRCRPGPRFP